MIGLHSSLLLGLRNKSTFIMEELFLRVGDFTSIALSDIPAMENLLKKFILELKQQDQTVDPSGQSRRRLVRLALCCANLKPMVTGSDWSSSSDADMLIPLNLPLNLQRNSFLSLIWKMEARALDLLQLVFARMEQSELFPLWAIVLPNAATSTYEISIVEKLLSTSSAEVQVAAAGVTATFITGAHQFFTYVERLRPSSALSFSPLYQSLGESLVEAHKALVSLATSLPEPGSHTSCMRALTVLVRHFPYEKLGKEVGEKLLDQVLDLSLHLTDNAHPAARIAGLNLHMAALTSEKSRRLWQRRQNLAAIFLAHAFPPEDDGCKDNNVRYVALQNLGQLATTDIDSLGDSAPDLKKVVEMILVDNDDAIVLHSLRTFKAIAKSARQEPRDAPAFMDMWHLLVRPRSFQAVERRENPNLGAALCDVISEIGEDIFMALTSDQRALCITYVVANCHGDRASARASAFRALGMLTTFHSLRSDASFLSDSTDVIVAAMEDPVCNADKATTTCVTWALANLADSLQIEMENSDHDVSRADLVRLMHVLVKPQLSKAHMNAKVNLLRATGCLLRCVDEQVFLCGGGEVASAEMLNLLRTLVRNLVSSMSDGSQHFVMKVRWNACHSAGKFLQNHFLSNRMVEEQDSVVLQLLCSFEKCSNFKVKIACAAALRGVADRRVILRNDGTFVNVLNTFIGQMEANEGSGNHGVTGGDAETLHRLEFLDNTVMTFCHLLNVASQEDLKQADCQLTRDQIDNVRFTMTQVRKRLSPEKEAALFEAMKHVEEHGGALSTLQLVFGG